MTTCARSGRCLSRRTTQRTIYRPGRDLPVRPLGAKAEIPVGHGQTRKGYVVVACLGYSRAGAGALVFSKQIAGSAGRDPPLPLAARGRCPTRWSGIARPACTATTAGRARSSPRSAAAEGRLAFLRAARSAGQGRGRALPGLSRPTSSPAAVRQRARLPRPVRRLGHRATPATTLRAALRPPGRGARGDGPAARDAPDTDRRWVPRIAPDPYLRFDTCDYCSTLLVGQRVEIRRHRSRDHRRRAGHRRAGLPPYQVLRQAPHDHRPGARPRR